MISGFEKPFQIRAVLDALARERTSHIYSPRHLEEIQRQEAIFSAALEEMIAQGIEDEPQDRQTGRPTLIRTTTGREYTEWVK